MSRANRRPLWQRGIWPVAVLAAVNLVGFLAYTRPRQTRQLSLTVRLENRRLEAESRRSAAEAARQTLQTIEANEKDEVRLLSTLLPTEAEGLLPVLQEIQSLVSASGRKSTGQGFGREQLPKSGIVRMPVTVPLEGGYRNLVGFLAEVEASKTFLTVDSITLQGQTGAGGGGGGRLQVELSAWFRGSEKTHAR